MAFLPIIQTGCIVAQSTISAAEATQMGFDSHPVSDLEFIDRLAQCRNGSRIFMPGDKTSIRRLRWPWSCHQAYIRAADRTGFNSDEDIRRAGLRGVHFFHLQDIRSHEHCCLHLSWDLQLFKLLPRRV
jgi:hypothetical protein